MTSTTDNSDPLANVTETLLRIACDAWTPNPPTEVKLSSLRAGPDTLLENAGDIRVDRGRFVVSLTAPARCTFQDVQVVEGTLSDDSTFRASCPLKLLRAKGLSIEYAIWERCGPTTPRFWIGLIEGATRIRCSGNLAIEEVQPDGLRLGASPHFRMQGAYVYYLIQTGDRDLPIWHLLIDTDGEHPDSTLLERDFLVLQLSLGRQLRVDALCGITKSGVTVASRSGIGERQQLNPTSQPPVPIFRDNTSWVDESWPPLFFERLVELWSKRDDLDTPLWMACEAYLDSMTSHLDANYLRLQIALEALATSLVRLDTNARGLIVRDEEDWSAWLEKHKAEIRAFATAGAEDSLFAKVANARFMASRKSVPEAFQLYDLALPKHLSRELEGRNIIAHRGVMSKSGDYTEQDIERVAMVRTMLIALLAKLSNYGGAINGWAVGTAGYPLVPESWWKTAELDKERSRHVFTVERDSPVTQ